MAEELNFYNQCAGCLLRLTAIRRGMKPIDSYQQPESRLSLLVFLNSTGQAAFGAQTHRLHKQHIMMVPGDVPVHLSLAGDGLLYYNIQFEALCPEPAGAGYAPLRLPGSVELFGSSVRLIADMIKEMERQLQSGDLWEAMNANVRFQELLIALLRQDEQERKANVNVGLQRTVEYMEQHISETITREQLAALAGLSPDYYTRAFKKRYQKSPMAYLTELRLRQAKRRMVESGESVRSIALSLGFQDEFYFSRKFKSETGFAPTVYVNRMREEGKVASLNHLVTGHMMALNMEPYAAVINNAFPAASELQHTLMVGQTEPELERLWKLRPDVMVVRGVRDVAAMPGEQLMNQIAPTVVLDYALDWREHLRTIARITGKQHEADRWLDRYQDTAGKIRSRLRRRWGEERVLIVGLGTRNKICVFGKRNIGTVLYDDLQLVVPEGVENIAHYKEVTLEELFHYEADRVILTCFQHDGSSYADTMIRQQARMLTESECWRKRQQERTMTVHTLFDTRHLYTSYNALSHQLLLGKVCELFGMNKEGGM